MIELKDAQNILDNLDALADLKREPDQIDEKILSLLRGQEPESVSVVVGPSKIKKPKVPKKEQRKKGDRICKKCGKVGHMQKTCKAPSSVPMSATSQSTLSETVQSAVRNMRKNGHTSSVIASTLDLELEEVRKVR